MKILMALEGDFPPDLRVENEIKSLIAAGHSVVMACYTLKGINTVFDWNGCRIYKKKISPFIYKSSVGALMFPFYFNFWRKHIQSVINLEKPDAIHIHDLPLAKLGFEFKKKLDLKFTLDLHENWPAYLSVSSHANTFLGKILSSNSQWKKYEKEQCLNADNVIVVIDEAKDRLIGIGIPENKVRIVANYPVLSDFDGVDTIPLDKDKQILFYAGGIGEHRGLQYVVSALPRLLAKYPNIELWILGDGNYRSTLENLSNDLGVSKHVIFFGHVPYKTVLDKLAQCTIALIPHEKSEHTDSTIPHKLFQYMFAGKPIVASDCTPIQRIIDSTGAGKSYCWNSSEDCASKINEVFCTLEQYDPSSVRDQIVKRYNWDYEGSRLVDQYNEKL